jgi:hypothetical protein
METTVEREYQLVKHPDCNKITLRWKQNLTGPVHWAISTFTTVVGVGPVVFLFLLFVWPESPLAVIGTPLAMVTYAYVMTRGRPMTVTIVPKEGVIFHDGKQAAVSDIEDIYISSSGFEEKKFGISFELCFVKIKVSGNAIYVASRVDKALAVSLVNKLKELLPWKQPSPS